MEEAGLQALMQIWLDACGVDTVAMESTGVYWIPLFELLESRGFKVFQVNARHVKNVSGRKSDLLDCQWLQQLMSYGLLRGAFRPTEAVCVLRSLWRQRGMLLRSQGTYVQRMQKTLTQMNIQLTNVISEVVVETGQKILRAIVAGERDGQVLAAMKNGRISSLRIVGSGTHFHLVSDLFQPCHLSESNNLTFSGIDQLQSLNYLRASSMLK
ncbi:protein of unknown function [Candidatus Nitrotoga arctica]|uniref:Transposase IS110-like N-terminal domain-containing protein n=1 Tax=Candidatus Nitrotoga arctica TaxID=453162 RepID=A0ABM8YYK8_9PROT|nr:protein of unknown function [Candidatus Nitrotoga arctica]